MELTLRNRTKCATLSLDSGLSHLHVDTKIGRKTHASLAPLLTRGHVELRKQKGKAFVFNPQTKDQGFVRWLEMARSH